MDRRDVVDQALEVLAQVGLPDLTMRRLGKELGGQQSALYHHFANKQVLLGAVADEILRRGPQLEVDSADPVAAADWERVRALCRNLRTAVLAYPDGADVVSSMFAFGLGGRAPETTLTAALTANGLAPAPARTAARTLLHYVHGHTVSQQAHEHAVSLGAIAPAAPDSPAAEQEFEHGLHLVVTGIEAASRPPATVRP